MRWPARAAAFAATTCMGLALFLAPAPGASAQDRSARPRQPPAPIQRAGPAEERLLEIYRLIGRGESRAALDKADQLVKAHPNFQLAQLVHGDLLAARVPPAPGRFGPAGVPRPPDGAALEALRTESRQRLQALRERPSPGTVPSQFLALSPRSRHAIAVDASRARLYLLRNSAAGLQLVGDYYVSVGKSGIGKRVEGDTRTPLGVYHITSNLDPTSLRDFYGAGALPINYPNADDIRLGRSGSGIWLHGTPPDQFARPPQATDGCIVLSNPDLRQLLRVAQAGATPVVIAQRLEWVAPAQAKSKGQDFGKTLAAWRDARSQGDLERLAGFYAAGFERTGRLARRLPTLRDEIAQVRGRRIALKDTSYLHWHPEPSGDDTMVAIFGEVIEGEKTGLTRRQYWLRTPGGWKVFSEELLS